MKAIILAGGNGTRLRPATISVSKQLLPVYDKPLIYYPLSTVILAGVKEVLIITSPNSLEQFKDLLGDGQEFGISISFAIQEVPNGIPEALIIGEEFLSGESCILTLGDNILYGPRVGTQLQSISSKNLGAGVFAYETKNLERFGAVVIDPNGKALSLEEKPKNTTARHAAVGFYILDETATARAKELNRSSRGELEIIDLLETYLQEQRLAVEILPLTTVWFDAGTASSLQDAANFVRITKDVRGLSIGSPHEAAAKVGTIGSGVLRLASARFNGSDYGDYLSQLAQRLELGS